MTSGRGKARDQFEQGSVAVALVQAECAFSVDHMPFTFIATDENGLPSRLTTMSLIVAAYFLK